MTYSLAGAKVSTSGPVIERAETIAIRVPLDRQFATSHFVLTEKACLFIRIHTSGGIVGEAFVELGDVGTVEAVGGIVRDVIDPAIRGAEVFGYEWLWERVRESVRDYSPWYDRYVQAARGCVDAAIWDAIGKALGLPLWRLWGGTNASIPVIWIGGYYGSEIEPEMESMLERGAAGVKFKVGGRSPDEDAARVRRARAVGGDDFVLVVDANCGWEVPDAVRFGRLVADLDVRWFEEPSRRDNALRGWRDIRALTGLSVGGGQSDLFARECFELIAEGAIDVCNFDALWAAGPTEWRRVAGFAGSFGCAMAHHQQPTVAAHLLASIPHGTYVEIYTPERDPIWWGAIANRPAMTDGLLALPALAGYGWEYDWEWLERFRL